MSLGYRDGTYSSPDVEIRDGPLNLSPEEVLQMSEPEYRLRTIRKRTPLTKPDIQSVERSIGREREKLEDYYDSESGPEKWIKIADSILPRWAEVLSELKQREEYAEGAIKRPEELYRFSLSGWFKQTASNAQSLKEEPEDREIVNFVKSYRNLEELYAEEIHPYIDSSV